MVVVVIFMYGVGLRDVKYGHAEKVLINSQYASNKQGNKQLVNSE